MLSWICWRWFLYFSIWEIHYDWGIDEGKWFLKQTHDKTKPDELILPHLPGEGLQILYDFIRVASSFSSFFFSFSSRSLGPRTRAPDLSGHCRASTEGHWDRALAVEVRQYPCQHVRINVRYPLVNIQKAIENGNRIVEFPIKNGDFR